MNNSINIKGNNQTFPYLIEYIKDAFNLDDHQIGYAYSNNDICLFDDDVKHFRSKNEWYSTASLQMTNGYVPNSVKMATININIPSHPVTTYIKNIKYCLTANTWINGVKINLGSFIFNPNDTCAIPTGVKKNGQYEYHEYISFSIIDPFELTYSDDWSDFRYHICKEPSNINNTGSLLQVSLFIVDEYENKYLMTEGYTGGTTAFNISKDDDFLTLGISIDERDLKLDFNIDINDSYDSLTDYLNETYGIDADNDSIKYEVVLKSNDEIIEGPTIDFAGESDAGYIKQSYNLLDLLETDGIEIFFSSWDNYEHGWNIVASLNVTTENEEFVIISNALPITQDIFSILVNGGAKQINITDMTINTYNVVNKIENTIVQLERPNESKSNVIQPVFFRTKDSEVLTLHPVVTENICINLDDYKSKVEKFILQIDGNLFNQIGANHYGILFKIPANFISSKTTSGTYYILNESKELVTTGKFVCVR